MTNEIHDCRPLYKESRQIYSTCGFTCFTNHKEAVAITEHDERYTCIDVNKNREKMGGSNFFGPYWKALKTGTLINVAKHFLIKRTISTNFDPAGVSLDTKFRKTMSEHGGHTLFPAVKQFYIEGDTPFNRSVISISEAWDYFKIEKRLKGSLNELSDCLVKLKCQKLGACRHKLSKKEPILYLTKNFDFFKGMTTTEIANNYWLPIECGAMSTGSEKYNLNAMDIAFIREKLKELDAYEDLMNKEPEDPNIIKVDEVTDIPDEIKKRSKK